MFFEDGVKAWTDGVDVGQNTIDQAKETAKLPFIYKYIALMPDCHLGKGSTVGSVIPTINAVIPAAVGVDIGCGMISTRFDFDARDLTSVDIEYIRQLIECAVPCGRSDNGQRDDIGAWGGAPFPVLPEKIKARYGSHVSSETLAGQYLDLLEDDPELEHPRALGHLGTLGTGNHFLEVQKSAEGQLWITIHSGLRGPGARIGGVFMKRAQAIAKQYHIDQFLPNMDLSYFPEGTPEFDRYWKALQWAQKYAWENREAMMEAAITAIKPVVGTLSAIDEVHCHHNYARRENHGGRNVIITRKGAISAREGEFGIIPGSMSTKTFIVRGKGNRESFQSASHGAGRKMSRTEAKRTLSLEDHIKQTEGISCLKDMSIIDEAAGAYKDINAVMAAQADLVDIVHTLYPIAVVKGKEEKSDRR